MDGSLYYQPCYHCKKATETIISPQAVVDASDTFVTWHQTGHKGGILGSFQFESLSGLLLMTLPLHSINGLYYCPLDVLTVDSDSISPRVSSVSRIALDVPIPYLQTPSKYKPVSKERQLESEVWSLCLGCPGKSQLDVLPGNVLGLPSVLEYHPFSSTFMLRLTSGSKLLKDQLSAWNTTAKNFTWILVLCVPPPTTTANPQMLLTVWYNLMMATPHT